MRQIELTNTYIYYSKQKIVSISETSLLYSRVRNERNQIGNSGSSASGLVAGSSSSSVNIGTSSADGNLSGRSGAVAASGGSAAGPAPGSASGERDSFSRWRDRQYYGPRRWFTSSREDSQWDKDNGKIVYLIYW